MTRLVLTPQMPASWMLALADGAPTDAQCPICDRTTTTSLVAGAALLQAPDGQFLQQFAGPQLQVVRLMLDWLRVSLASSTRPERGRSVAAAAAEAARRFRIATQRRPANVSLTDWSALCEIAGTWADANDAIEAFAIVRAGGSRSVDLLHRDALRTSARETSRQLGAARAALSDGGVVGVAGAMDALADAFEGLGGVEHHGLLSKWERAVEAWAALVPTAPSDCWWSELLVAQRELAEAMSVWLDGVGAGGDVAVNLSAERAPIRLAAWSAASVAVRAGTTRAGDLSAIDWPAQAEAARSLAAAAIDTDRVTHAGTSNAGPIGSAEERPLDERQLKLTASHAASSWLKASTCWAVLGQDAIAHACRSTAVALGAVAVLDGITAATLGWAAREAWRSAV